MNFLGLVNRLKQECGVSGADLSTVVGVTGEAKRLKDWIASAWSDIQAEHSNWRFMRKSMTLALTTNQGVYTVAQSGVTDLATWIPESFRIYTTAIGYGSESYLSEMDYTDWRDVYQFGTQRTSYSQPIAVTITPTNGLAFGPAPDAAGYTVVGDYYKTPVEFSADADVPDIAARFHMVIVYAAMMSYAMFENAPEVAQRADNGYRSLLRLLEADQLPVPVFGGPLV